MYRWICLITVKSPNQREPEPFRSRSHFSSRSFSVRSKVRRGLGVSPLSDYLYSPTPTNTSSPYTEFFSQHSPRPQYLDVTLTSTSTNTSSGSEDSSVLTSPGRISPVRRSVSTTSSVYSQLFRPDLIVLSSPLHTKHQSEQQRFTRSSSSNQTARTRDEFTKTWLEDNKRLH